jgi:integrase
MFRHHAAEMYLDETPNGYETVRQLLGHRSSETAARFYVRRNQTKALRRYVDRVLKVRHESLRWRLPKKPRGATDKKTHDGKDKR